MNSGRLGLVVVGIVVGLVIAAGLLWLLDGSQVYAAPDMHYVAPGGICNGPTPCYGNLQTAVDAASPGDEILVAAGTFTDIHVRGGTTQTVYISQSVSIQGGYSTSNWLTPDPENNHSILDAQNLGRVFFAVGGGVSIELTGLRITGGRAPVSEHGGGVHIDEVDYALLNHNWIYSNTGSVGGGVYIHRSDSSTVTDNQFYSNTATNSGAGIYFHNTGNPTLSNNHIYQNHADTNGGGVYLATAYYETTLADNIVHHNTAGAGGGGIFVFNSNGPQLTGNQIYSNTAGAQAGGLYMSGTRDAVVSGNVIKNNSGNTNGGGVYISQADRLYLFHNEVSHNTSTGSTGGGAFLYNSKFMAIEDNAVHHNTASAENGGGFYINSCNDATLKANTFYQNTGVQGGGVYVRNSGNVILEKNEIFSNTAASGAGATFYGDQHLLAANNAIWENQNTGVGYGAGVYVIRTDLYLSHSTIARNHGTHGYGLYLSNNSTLYLTNTILVSNTAGIRVAAGSTATLEATLWGSGIWANDSDWINDGTLITGTLNWWQEPGFVDPNAGDYHLAFGSAARDKGTDTDVETDIDGDSRVFGAPPDLGYHHT